MSEISRNPPVPAVAINGGQLARINTWRTMPGQSDEAEILKGWLQPILPPRPFEVPEGGRPCLAISKYLNDHGIKYLDVREKRKHNFWPPQLLEEVFGKPIICMLIRDLIDHKELPPYPPGNTEEARLDQVERWTRRLFPDYRVILFVLSLIRKQQDIYHFFAATISDKCLPLDADAERLLCKSRVVCSDLGWDEDDTESFERRQWRANLRVLKSEQNDEVPDFDLGDRAVRPWIEFHEGPSMPQASSDFSATSTSYAAFGGAFGEVKKIFIHPMLHELDDDNDSVRTLNFEFLANI